MDGVHDMGGMHGFGAIEFEENEPVFHDDWERRIFALTMACFPVGQWPLDKVRHTIEKMPPAQYLGAAYYEKWADCLERMLLERNILTEAEIAARRAELAENGG